MLAEVMTQLLIYSHSPFFVFFFLFIFIFIFNDILFHREYITLWCEAGRTEKGSSKKWNKESPTRIESRWSFDIYQETVFPEGIITTTVWTCVTAVDIPSCLFNWCFPIAGLVLMKSKNV